MIGQPTPGAGADADRLGWALLPLRLFLGLTFVYGGIQKLSDPGYLHPGASTYIGTQLRGFANGTPGGFLLRGLALPHPSLAGVGVALAEIAIGLLVTAGVLTAPAALAGLGLNLLLFLTNSWHTYPYFLGSDIVFVFAWLPFVLVGSRRQLTLESAIGGLASEVGRRRTALSIQRPEDPGRVAGVAQLVPGEYELTRRAVISTALTVAGATTAAIAGLSTLARGSYRAPRALGASRSGSARTTASTKRPPRAAHAPASGVPSNAVKVGSSRQLPVGKAAIYRDPGDGRADIAIRMADGSLTAHSAICTHAGCTVGYQGGQIACPCHGAVFDASTGAVLSGPAPSPLAPRRLLEHGGEIYAIPSA